MFSDWKRKRLAKRASRLARSLSGLRAEVDQLDKTMSSINGQVAIKPVRPWELWVSLLGLILIAGALGGAAWAFVANAPERGWVRENADLIGATFVWFAVVLQGVTAVWDHWGGDTKRASGAISAVAVWSSFIGAALVAVSIVNPGI